MSPVPNRSVRPAEYIRGVCEEGSVLENPRPNTIVIVHVRPQSTHVHGLTRPVVITHAISGGWRVAVY